MSFKRLDPEDLVISSDSITSTLWSTGNPTLTTFSTSSVQEASSTGNFYLNVYSTSSSDETQFNIAYCNSLGNGSELYNGAVPINSFTSTLYGQYRSMILEDENSSFIFGSNNNTITGSDFWVISIERALYKEKLFPGTFNLILSGTLGEVHLTDNSRDVLVNTFLGSTRVYQIVSGSNGNSIPGGGYVTNSGSYGLFLPDIGTIILNPYAISQSIGVEPNRATNTNGFNNRILFDSIRLGESFSLNSEETITSDYVFIRARNSEFNYSVNPSFISGSTGELINSQFINNPQTYITTVGLYNDSNELLAVAKISKPLLKDFTKESLLRLKLDF
jgi:hypothetical protein